MKKLLFAVVAAFGLCLPGYAGTITVESDSVYELKAADNILDNIIHAKGGATIKLLFDEGTTEFKFLPKLKCDGGKVTVVADTVLDDLYMRGGLLTVNDGVIDIAAAKKLIFGSAHAPTYDTEKANNAINYQLFNATVSMTATDAQGIVLTNRVTAKKIDVNCPVSIADNAWIAIWSDDVLPVLGIVDDTLTLDGWNATVLGENVLANKNIVVNDRMVLALLPCAASGDWNWITQHYSSRKFKCNVVLNGQNSRLAVFGAGGITFMGDITGIGNLEIQREAAYNEGERSKFEIDGECTFKGDVLISASNRVVFASSSPGDASNIIKITGDNPIVEFDEASEVSIAGIESTIDARLLVGSGQQVNLGALKGRLSIVGDGVNLEGMVNIDTLDESSTLVMKSCVPVKIRTAGANTVYKVAEGVSEGLLKVDLTDFTGDTVPTFDIAEGVHLEVLGNKTVAIFEDETLVENKKLVVSESYTNTVEVSSGLRLDVNGKVTVKLPDWRKKVMNWFDAAEEDSLILYDIGGVSNPVFTNDFPFIMGWADRNTGTSGKYLFNNRSYTGEHLEVYPYVVTNGLNGLNYISMGAYYGTAFISGQTEGRRLPFWTGAYSDGKGTSINPAYVIMVYGSQFGGGGAVIGGSAYKRSTRTFSKDEPPTIADPFLSENSMSFNVDGVSVNPVETCPNGGWQILSFVSFDASQANNPAVGALGWVNNYNTSGGQNYAEVIFFNEALTDIERVECEKYLAEKWGLKSKYKGDSHCLLRTDGMGMIVIDGNVKMEGGFCGTIEVNKDKTLILSSGMTLPTEETIGSDGRIAWFDPNLEESIEDSDDEYRALSHLSGRDNSGVLDRKSNYSLHGTGTGNSDGTSTYDRRPAIKTRISPNGKTLNWIDFYNCMSGDSNAFNWGNNLRSRLSGQDAAISNVVTAFIVVDSSRGGGSIMADAGDIGFNGVPGARGDRGLKTKASDPIWPKRTGVFADVTTYLDNKQIAAAGGFTGKPEVLTVEFNGEAFAPRFFAAYNGDNNEIMGEMLFYSKKLSVEQRTDINAYLMYKWLGSTINGYCDFDGMTLAGAGTVVVPAGVSLPKISEDFTGNLVMEANNYEFTIDTSVSANSAVNAMSLNCSLTLPNDCTITIKPGTIVQPGEYKLVSAQSITAGGNVSLRFSGDYDWTRFNPRLVIENNSVVLKLSATSTVIIVR